MNVAKVTFAALAVVVAAVGGWVVFVLPGDTPAISYRTIAVRVGDPEKVVVTFEVTKEPSATAECHVTATGPDRELVDRLTGIVVPPAAQATTTHVVTVQTRQLADHAAVAYCAVTRG